MIGLLLRFTSLLSLLFGVIVAQDLSPYFLLVAEGQVDRVRDELPKLLEQYPDNPGVLFLDAITMERAENAIVSYKRLIQNHPNSPYADDAMLKVGEYLFARGLYTQSSRESAKIPKIYPTSEHIQRAIDLQINSLLAIGERDSAEYYIQFYRDRFPSLDFEYNLEPDNPLISRPMTAATPTPLSGGMKQLDVESLTEPPKPPFVSNKEEKAKPSTQQKPVQLIPKPYVIQVGAYGSMNNALKQKRHLEQMGYSVEMVPISSRGRTLQAVQVVRFSTRFEAEKVGKKLKSDFGYSYIILQRSE